MIRRQEKKGRREQGDRKGREKNKNDENGCTNPEREEKKGREVPIGGKREIWFWWTSRTRSLIKRLIDSGNSTKLLFRTDNNSSADN